MVSDSQIILHILLQSVNGIVDILYALVLHFDRLGVIGDALN